jgi:hypothetical protein
MKSYSVLIVLALAVLLAAASLGYAETTEKPEAEVQSRCCVITSDAKAQCVPCPSPCIKTKLSQSCVTLTGDSVQCVPCPSPCTTPQGSHGCSISGEVCVPDKAACCPGGRISEDAGDCCELVRRRSI